VVASKTTRELGTAAGVAVGTIFDQLGSGTIENVNEQYKGMFEVDTQVPTKGLRATQARRLGSILV
jgi:hypothetical protein